VLLDACTLPDCYTTPSGSVLVLPIPSSIASLLELAHPTPRGATQPDLPDQRRLARRPDIAAVPRARPPRWCPSPPLLGHCRAAASDIFLLTHPRTTQGRRDTFALSPAGTRHLRADSHPYPAVSSVLGHARAAGWHPRRLRAQRGVRLAARGPPTLPRTPSVGVPLRGIGNLSIGRSPPLPVALTTALPSSPSHSSTLPRSPPSRLPSRRHVSMASTCARWSSSTPATPPASASRSTT